jgi:hypothetical protein
MDNETKERQLGVALDLVLGDTFPRSLNAFELNLMGFESFNSDQQVKARAKDILLRSLLGQKLPEPLKSEDEVKESVENPGAPVQDTPNGAEAKPANVNRRGNDSKRSEVKDSS